MDPSTTYPTRSDRTAWRTIEEEAVIVMPEESQVKVLNATGSRIWELCDGTHSLSVIARRIADEFSVGPEEAEEDVTDFVRALAEKGLLLLTTERRHRR